MRILTLMLTSAAAAGVSLVSLLCGGYLLLMVGLGGVRFEPQWPAVAIALLGIAFGVFMGAVSSGLVARKGWAKAGATAGFGVAGVAMLAVTVLPMTLAGSVSAPALAFSAAVSIVLLGLAAACHFARPLASTSQDSTP